MIEFVLLGAGVFKAVQAVTDEEFSGTEFPSAFRKELINAHWQANKGWCPDCERKSVLKRDLTVDHVVPINRGGLNSRHNARVICGRCNSSKGDTVTFLDRVVGRGGGTKKRKR